MSPTQLEKKVEDYLRDSLVLEDHWQKLITAGQLQAELDRMARHTRQPEVLRELFEALGNDPVVIAECLARPILAERLIADLSAQDKTRRFQSAGIKGLRAASMTATVGNGVYTLPTISEGDSPCIDDTWTPTTVSNAPTGRYFHTAVWTGSEMIIWGGYGGDDGYLNTGGRYNPSTDSWTATSMLNVTESRQGHTAVWTGSEMIVWGGDNGTTRLNTGGRYNPGTDSWTHASTTNAPEGRDGHNAAWTGSEMIVWGGADSTGYLNTGGRYNPSTNRWTATSPTNAPDPRALHTAVWTGSQMIIWGGVNFSCCIFNTGGAYCAESSPPPTPTPTATPTATATPSGTPRPSPTPRHMPSPKPRPTPVPRP